jgi:aspartyl-tRNA synthetase
MYRSETCGQLRSSDIDKEVVLSGWVQKVRDKGFMIWADLRDRYGITQLIFDEEILR